MDTKIFKWFRLPEHKTLCPLKSYWCELVLAWVNLRELVAFSGCPVFYSSRPGSYIRPSARHVAPEWLAPYTVPRVLCLGIANDDFVAWRLFCPIALPHCTRSISWHCPVRSPYRCSYDQGWSTSCGGWRLHWSRMLAHYAGLTGTVAFKRCVCPL
jgi:hypothetical protein